MRAAHELGGGARAPEMQLQRGLPELDRRGRGRAQRTVTIADATVRGLAGAT